VARMQALPIP
jgi:hypothetical protein